MGRPEDWIRKSKEQEVTREKEYIEEIRKRDEEKLKRQEEVLQRLHIFEEEAKNDSVILKSLLVDLGIKERLSSVAHAMVEKPLIGESGHFSWRIPFSIELSCRDGDGVEEITSLIKKKENNIKVEARHMLRLPYMITGISAEGRQDGPGTEYHSMTSDSFIPILHSTFEGQQSPYWFKIVAYQGGSGYLKNELTEDGPFENKLRLKSLFGLLGEEYVRGRGIPIYKNEIGGSGDNHHFLSSSKKTTILSYFEYKLKNFVEGNYRPRVAKKYGVQLDIN